MEVAANERMKVFYGGKDVGFLAWEGPDKVTIVIQQYKIILKSRYTSDSRRPDITVN